MKLYQLLQWIKVDDYQIYIHDIREEYQLKSTGNITFVESVGLNQPPESVGSEVEAERLVYVDVEYFNPTRHKALSYRLNQWSLFDRQGYVYESEYPMSVWFRDRGRPSLHENVLNPQTRARGWMVFKPARAANVDRLHFLTGFLSGHAVDIDLTIKAPRLQPPK